MSAIVSIVAREFRANRWILSIGLALVAVSFALAFLRVGDSRVVSAWGALGLAHSLIFLAIAGSLFAAERRAGTLDFLLQLPMSRRSLFAGKLVAGLVQVGLLQAAYFGLMSFFTWRLGEHWRPFLAGLPGLAAMSAAGFSLSFLAGIYTRSTILAALGGGLAVQALQISLDERWRIEGRTAVLFALSALAALGLAYRGVRRLEPRQVA
jgi:ABC-type transport system involved in multi-copper enzyme maturation permease subunit